MSDATEYALSVHLIQEGVNMGDHGQDVVKAVDVTPETTLRELSALLFKRSWGHPIADKAVEPDNARIEIRVARPLDKEHFDVLDF